MFLLLRFVIYIDSKAFDKELENARWSTGEDAFFNKFNDFIAGTYGPEYKFENDYMPKLKPYKKLKKNLAKIKELTFE